MPVAMWSPRHRWYHRLRGLWGRQHAWVVYLLGRSGGSAGGGERSRHVTNGMLWLLPLLLLLLPLEELILDVVNLC